MPDIGGAFGKVKDNVQQNLGAIEKAVIEIYDLRLKPGTTSRPVTMEPVEAKGSKNGVMMGPGGNGGSAKMTYLDQRSVADLLTVANHKGKDTDLTNAKEGLSNAVSQVGQDQALSLSGITRKLYEVQFNPSMVQLSAHGGGVVRQVNYANNTEDQTSAGAVTYKKEETTIILSVPLFFDRCDIQDAFGADKLNTSATEVLKGAAKAAMTMAGKKEVTVQREVEGFVGMIRNRYTRFVTFHWGDFSYSGSVNNVDVKYTMFNITGQPVRATVNLSIMCLNKVMKGSAEVWRDIYKRAYSQKGGVAGKLESIGNTAKQWTGSFLNL